MERSKELSEWASKGGAAEVVQSGVREFTARKEGRAVERPTVFGRRLPKVGRARDRQRQERREQR